MFSLSRFAATDPKKCVPSSMPVCIPNIAARRSPYKRRSPNIPKISLSTPTSTDQIDLWNCENRAAHCHTAKDYGIKKYCFEHSQVPWECSNQHFFLLQSFAVWRWLYSSANTWLSIRDTFVWEGEISIKIGDGLVTAYYDTILRWVEPPNSFANPVRIQRIQLTTDGHEEYTTLTP